MSRTPSPLARRSEANASSVVVADASECGVAQRSASRFYHGEFGGLTTPTNRWSRGSDLGSGPGPPSTKLLFRSGPAWPGRTSKNRLSKLKLPASESLILYVCTCSVLLSSHVRSATPSWSAAHATPGTPHPISQAQPSWINLGRRVEGTSMRMLRGKRGSDRCESRQHAVR